MKRREQNTTYHILIIREANGRPDPGMIGCVVLIYLSIQLKADLIFPECLPCDNVITVQCLTAWRTPVAALSYTTSTHVDSVRRFLLVADIDFFRDRESFSDEGLCEMMLFYACEKLN